MWVENVGTENVGTGRDVPQFVAVSETPTHAMGRAFRDYGFIAARLKRPTG
jgi:hypothetical protein